MIRHNLPKRGIAALICSTVCFSASAQVQDSTTSYLYDKLGNVVQVTDPLNQTTVFAYDALSRKTSVTDASLGVTEFGYNGLDQLTQVTDARKIVTSYVIDGLGNLKQVTSADTGISTRTYDEAGNVLTSTDAKLQKTSYAYDALDRVTLITLHDGATVAYKYDQGTHGLGRLSSVTDSGGSIAYAYDQHGRVTMETRVISGVTYVTSYRFDLNGQLSGMTYPSGRVIEYGRDIVGRINSISTTFSGAVVPLVAQVNYEPFGPVKAITLGNGRQQMRPHDLDGRLSSFSLAAQTMAVSYDAASRIKGIADMANPAAGITYGYDPMDRLTSVIAPGTAQTYAYDLAGNRKEKVNNNVVTPYKYEGAGNRLTQVGTQAITADVNGSITDKGSATFAYDVRGRMVSANTSIGLVKYTINALGQRVRKETPTESTAFHYDLGGKLIAEATTAGGVTTVQEYVYLGDMPVAALK